MRFQESTLAIGTAFFYCHEGTDFLVTNWHNASGRRPLDLAPLSKHAAIPDNLVVRIPTEVVLKEGQSAIRWEPKVLPLYDEQQVPIWWVHPDEGSAIDVVVIQLDGEASTTKVVQANADSLGMEKLALLPGMDLFILGFPKGLSGGGRFPIWKRGSLASEPDIDLDGVPKLYVDSATREGMSGAPVYAQESGFWAPEGGSLPTDGVFGKGRRFVGIYSGRVGDDQLGAQLGVVWKERAIVEVIRGGRRGQSSFELATDKHHEPL